MVDKYLESTFVEQDNIVRAGKPFKAEVTGNYYMRTKEISDFFRSISSAERMAWATEVIGGYLENRPIQCPPAGSPPIQYPEDDTKRLRKAYNLLLLLREVDLKVYTALLRGTIGTQILEVYKKFQKNSSAKAMQKAVSNPEVSKFRDTFALKQAVKDTSPGSSIPAFANVTAFLSGVESGTIEEQLNKLREEAKKGGRKTRASRKTKKTKRTRRV